MKHESERDLRRRSARVLATADYDELAALWNNWSEKPEATTVHGPQVGLVMVQGRSGGSGDRFNLGEATVTRASVAVRTTPESDSETVGTAYILGSHPQHSVLAATVDALLLGSARDKVVAEVIEPLERSANQRDARHRAEARSTVVDFFTVARESTEDDEGDE